MFAPKAEPIPEVAEDAPKEAKADRVPLEQDVDRMRARALEVQAWTSKAFADPDAEASGFRVSYQSPHYYVEVLRKDPYKPAYGFTGLFVHERDLLNLTTVLVQAVRDYQAKHPKGPDADK